jgi:hypothetical protein
MPGRFRDARPRHHSWRTTDVTALEERRGWLGTQGRDPQTAPDTPDGHSDFGFLTEVSCAGCGAGEHELDRCWQDGDAA